MGRLVKWLLAALVTAPLLALLFVLVFGLNWARGPLQRVKASAMALLRKAEEYCDRAAFLRQAVVAVCDDVAVQVQAPARRFVDNGRRTWRQAHDRTVGR